MGGPGLRMGGWALRPRLQLRSLLLLAVLQAAAWPRAAAQREEWVEGMNFQVPQTIF